MRRRRTLEERYPGIKEAMVITATPECSGVFLFTGGFFGITGRLGLIHMLRKSLKVEGDVGMQPGVRWGKKVAELLEIPPDIVLDLPRVTMVGNIEITLENHRGIIEYTPARLRLALPQGELIVSGNELILVSLAQEEVVIRGRIKSLELA